ncbi:HFL002Cp [Eremothecium sinecaudum]|uniref:HFL002Cp n=1 Tax=Eremothecium sinecaudum TaxID=45286 RepID=A0A0X8HUP4_9SACH|nr:HFL002Cp [Eremothecium sinecaudum]AMD21854.1 HFL002Cp [Eremothecium sinecaudum]
MQTIPTPDQLVHRACEEIAYHKGRIPFQSMWEIIGTNIELRNDRIKEYVFNCLLSHPDIGLLKSGSKTKDITYQEAMQNKEKLEFFISEDRLWVLLTGYAKKESPIGGLAFDLLMEIAKTKQHGANTMELAAITKQDPRSITGRIKKLGNLVTGVQIIYKGHVVKLIKYHRFADTKPKRLYVNMKQYLPVIVDTVKKSKNGVRQVVDLKRELKLDKDKRLNKAFIAAIAWLDEKNYLKKVIVVSPSNPNAKVRCVQYVKDYIPEEKDSAEFDNESEDDNDDDDDEHEALDSKDPLDNEDIAGGFEGGNVTNILQNSNLLIEENTESVKHFSMNRFFPLQNQTFALTDRHGTQGISTMECVNTIMGNDYKRSFTKNSEYYLQTVGKSKPNKLQNLGYELVRVYDFEGKKKFYRLFTQKNFLKFTGTSDSGTSITLPSEVVQKSTLSELSARNFMPLNTTLRFTTKEGKDVFFWHGELDIPATSSTTARGRKRKVAGELISQESKKQRLPESFPKRGTASKNDSQDVSHVSDNTLPTKNSLVNIGGFTAYSLKSIQRQKAILDVVRRYGGITYIKDQLYEDVSKSMGTKMILDKKTLRGDVELLVAANKLHVREHSNGRNILYLPSVKKDDIVKYITSTKETKVVFSKDIIKNTDIYFFDQTEHDKFHRGTKSVERVKAFENKTKRAKGTGAQSSVSNSNSTSKYKVSMHKKRAKDLASGVEKVETGLDQLASKKKATSTRKKAVKPTTKSSKEIFNVSTKEGSRALVMAVVITKSIKGQTLWQEILLLFPNNSLEHLKKKWTLRRVKMGHGGWRALMEKWRKIMVDAVKDGRASLEDAEQLNLTKLVRLWMAADEVKGKDPIKLYKDYEENYQRYTLVKNSQKTSVHVSLAMSSMIQRESFLLKQLYTYDVGAKPLYTPTEEQIRSIVRSILISSTSIDKDEIDILGTFNNELVDKVILDMARERHISFVGSSKLQLTDVVLDLLDTKGKYEQLEKASSFKKKSIEILNTKKAIVLAEEPSNHSTSVLIDMLDSKMLTMAAVPLPLKENSMYYATRKYEVTALTPPLILFNTKKLQEPKLKRCPIPLNKPFSRLWIDSHGLVREKIWKQLVFIVVNEILFNPGITIQTLARRFRKILSQNEVEDIIKWLQDLSVLLELKFNGYLLAYNWHHILG